MARSQSHEAGPVRPRATGGGAGWRRGAGNLMIVVLIPLNVWTIAGLIACWPGRLSSHLTRWPR